MFLQFGEIVSAKLMEDKNGNSKGFGFVSYFEYSSENKSFFFKNNKVFGETLEIKHFKKKKKMIMTQISIMSGYKDVYVTNIPKDTHDVEINNLFKKYGNITWM